MAVHVNQDVRWYVGQYSVACNAKSATLQNECEALDVTPLCTTGATSFIGGLRSGSFNLELMQDFDNDTLDDNLWALLTSDSVPQSFTIGGAAGSRGYVLRSRYTNYSPNQGAVGELGMASLSGVSTGAIARGRSLAVDASALTTSGTTTPLQAGALTASQEMLVALHVTTATGTSPTLACVIQSDDLVGFASPTNRLTLATATATTNRAQVGTIAGAVTDTWWRVSYTIGGTTPSFRFAVIVGIRSI